MASESRADSDHASRPYVVLARRYRPQTFDQLLGQEHVVHAITNAIHSGRVGHAYLFTGARGVGKTSAARILAKSLNCKDGTTVKPCCECDICLSIGDGEDVDVLEIDGASNRGIDEIRQLRQNVGVRPTRSRFKIYIIDEVHMLTKEAFNALLKTLEEPPPHVKFIFATTEPNKIPATILSRCQRFDFAGIETSRIREHLLTVVEGEGLNAEMEAIELVSQRAGGSMRDGQSLLEQLLAVGKGCVTVQDAIALLGLAPATRLGRIVEHVVEQRAGEALVDLDDALAAGVDAGSFLEQMLGYFRDLMAVHVGCGPEQMRFTSASQHPEIQRWAGKLDLSQVLASIQILEQTLGRLRVSVHARTLAELAIVRLARLEQLDQLPDLIAKIDSADSVASAPPLPRSPANAAARSAHPPPAEARPSLSDSEHRRRAETAPDNKELAMTDQAAARLWSEAIARLDAGSELVAEYAAKAQLTSAGRDRLVACFPARYGSLKKYCENPGPKEKLEAVVENIAGRRFHLEFAVAAEDGGVEAPVAVPTRRQMQIKIGMRPFVRRAMQLFNAVQIQVESPRG